MARFLVIAFMGTATALLLKDDGAGNSEVTKEASTEASVEDSTKPRIADSENVANLGAIRQTGQAHTDLAQEMTKFGQLAQQTNAFRKLVELADFVGKHGQFPTSKADVTTAIGKLQFLGKQAISKGDMKAANQIQDLGHLLVLASQGNSEAVEQLKVINQMTEFGSMARKVIDGAKAPKQTTDPAINEIIKAAKAGDKAAIEGLKKISEAGKYGELVNAAKRGDAQALEKLKQMGQQADTAQATKLTRATEETTPVASSEETVAQ